MATNTVLSFGLFADLHYIDIDNGLNFNGTRVRRFRQSLDILKEGIGMFNERKTTFNMLLGDILDGKAKTNNMNFTCLDTVLQLTENVSMSKVYFTLGNHECYNYNREEMLNRTPFIPKPTSVLTDAIIRDKSTPLYYSFVPVMGYRCIVFDGYDISSINPSSEEYYQYAEALLRAKNPAYADGRDNWFDSILPENRRYVPFNGGIGKEQLLWLQHELQACVIANEKCIIFSHMPLESKASQEQNVIWNCEEVLQLIYTYGSISDGSDTCKNCVVAVISGHDHNGGYYHDTVHGIHHIVPTSPIECNEGQVSYGIVSIHQVIQQQQQVEESIDTSIPSSYISIEWTGKLPPARKQWPNKLYI